MGQYCTTKRAIGLLIIALIVGAIILYASGVFSSKAQQLTQSPPDPTKDILLVNLVSCRCFSSNVNTCNCVPSLRRLNYINKFYKFNF